MRSIRASGKAYGSPPIRTRRARITDIVIGRVGLARVNRMLDSLGYRETRLRMTVGQTFRAVWELLDPKYASLTDREVYERGSPGE